MMNSAAIKGQKERKIPVMEKIASFTIDHIKLKPGIYVSRKDHVGDSVITTFDLRMTSPNDEPVMNTAEVTPSSILAQRSCVITKSGKIKPYILVQWAAVQDFTCCWPVITARKISFHS